ncbi:hypothetical protein ACO1O0_008688 [Amphichorda felina]
MPTSLETASGGGRGRIAQKNQRSSVTGERSAGRTACKVNHVPCNIENVPADILLLIMMELSSVEALQDLIRVSPACRRTFDGFGGRITIRLLEHDGAMSSPAFHFAHAAAAVRTGMIRDYMPCFKSFNISLGLPIDIFKDQEIRELYASMTAEELHLFVRTACHIRRAARVCVAFPNSCWRFESEGDTTITSVSERLFSSLLNSGTWQLRKPIRGFCSSKEYVRHDGDESDDPWDGWLKWNRSSIGGDHYPGREFTSEQRAVVTCWRLQLLQEVYHSAAEHKLGWTDADHDRAMSPGDLDYEVFLRDPMMPRYDAERVAIHNAHIRRELELVKEYIVQRFGKDGYRQRHRKRLLPVDLADEKLAQISPRKKGKVRAACVAVFESPLLRRLTMGGQLDDFIMSSMEIVYSNGVAALLPESTIADQD